MNMKNYIKFACVYCGQHVECGPEFSGRQFHCPACRQRLVVPPPDGSQATRPPASVNQTWDTQVPDPRVETPTRYRMPDERSGRP
jgi:DNA-directed RNA polymerase subunit RPC12/RpoP